MENHSHTTPKNRSGQLWWFALLAWCVCLFVVRIYVFVPLYKYSAELFIVPLIASVIPWSVFYFFFGRKKESHQEEGAQQEWQQGNGGKISFVAIYCAFLIGGFYTNSLQKQESMLLLTDVENKLEAFFAMPVDDQGIPSQIEVIARAADPSKKINKMDDVFIQMINMAVHYRNDYFAELTQCGWFSVLDAKKMAGDLNMKASRQTTACAKTVAAKYRIKSNLLINEMREVVDKSALSEKEKEGYLLGMDNNLQSTHEQREQMWALEERCIQEVEKIIAFLDARAGRWVEDNGAFAFTSQEDIDQFNLHMYSINQIAAEQASIQNLRQNYLKENISRLRKRVE